MVACNVIFTVTLIKKRYADKDLDLEKIMRFTSDRASVKLDKNNALETVFGFDLKHCALLHDEIDHNRPAIKCPGSKSHELEFFYD
jgi:hypothetical protein